MRERAKAIDAVDQFVGTKLRLRRLALHISQQQLAKTLGITFQQIQKYEKGVNRIGAERLYKVAVALAVPIYYFYEGLEIITREAIRSGGEGALCDPNELIQFMATEEAMQLCRAFRTLRRRETKRAIVQLVCSVSASESAND